MYFRKFFKFINLDNSVYFKLWFYINKVNLYSNIKIGFKVRTWLRYPNLQIPLNNSKVTVKKKTCVINMTHRRIKKLSWTWVIFWFCSNEIWNFWTSLKFRKIFEILSRKINFLIEIFNTKINFLAKIQKASIQKYFSVLKLWRLLRSHDLHGTSCDSIISIKYDA